MGDGCEVSHSGGGSSSTGVRAAFLAHAVVAIAAKRAHPAPRRRGVRATRLGHGTRGSPWGRQRTRIASPLDGPLQKRTRIEPSAWTFPVPRSTGPRASESTKATSPPLGLVERV